MGVAPQIALCNFFFGRNSKIMVKHAEILKSNQLEHKTNFNSREISILWACVNYVTQICELRLHFKIKLEWRVFDFTWFNGASFIEECLH